MKNILKKRKVKKSIEFKELGFIVPTARISLALNPKIGRIGEFLRCEFDDECDRCKSPKKGSYVLMNYGADYEEAEYYICGKCAIKTHHSGYIAEIQHWRGYADYVSALLEQSSITNK